MEDLLLLVHRIPYPPNKGDKIRSYHLLKHLAKRYTVHLGTFIDDPDDWKHVETVRSLCGETHFAELKSLTARIRSLPALLSSRPLTLDYYRNASLHAWVRNLMQKKSIKRALVFSSAMAQYVPQQGVDTRVIDFVDIDSDKWMQYADKKRWPMNWLYRREGRTLLNYERQIARRFDASLFVSEAEAAMFRKLAPESAHKTGFFNNGVDTDYFSPDRQYDNPFAADEKPLVFTGAMDYWPNVDAVQWFARDIFPAVLKAHADARFYIVGMRPTADVQALASLPGVRVTGAVPDVRPYLAHAKAAVSPLRIARGIQNKVLEAMAMAKPVIVSPQALEGIHAAPGRELLLAETVEPFAAAVCSVLGQPGSMMGAAARAKVDAIYGWAGCLAKVDALLAGNVQTDSPSPSEKVSM